jgi:hypothetical protein
MTEHHIKPASVALVDLLHGFLPELVVKLLSLGLEKQLAHVLFLDLPSHQLLFQLNQLDLL